MCGEQVSRIFSCSLQLETRWSLSIYNNFKQEIYSRILDCYSQTRAGFSSGMMYWTILVVSLKLYHYVLHIHSRVTCDFEFVMNLLNMYLFNLLSICVQSLPTLLLSANVEKLLYLLIFMLYNK